MIPYEMRDQEWTGFQEGSQDPHEERYTLGHEFKRASRGGYTAIQNRFYFRSETVIHPELCEMGLL